MVSLDFSTNDKLKLWVLFGLPNRLLLLFDEEYDNRYYCLVFSENCINSSTLAESLLLLTLDFAERMIIACLGS